MTLKLYYNLLFAPSRAVYMFLNLAKIPFERKEVITKGTKIVGNYKKIYKFETLPILEDNDFKIMESVAIIRYLAQQYPSSNAWYPQDSKEQAKVDEYLSWQHHNTSFLCYMFFQQQYLKPLLTGTKPDEKKIEPYKDRMIDCLDKLEEVWLSENKFLAGNKLTLADISCINDMEQIKLAGYDPKIDHPLLTAWMTNVETALNPEYDEVNKLCLKMLK